MNDNLNTQSSNNGGPNQTPYQPMPLPQEPLEVFQPETLPQQPLENNYQVEQLVDNKVNFQENGQATYDTKSTLDANVTKKKIILIICIAIFVIVIGIFVGKTLLTHKGPSKKLAPDVTGDYTCTMSTNQNGVDISNKVDIVFSSNGYETTVYYRVKYEYESLNDDQMLQFLKDADPYGGSKSSPNYNSFNVNGVTNLGTVEKYGYETIIERKDNVITMTYYKTNLNNYETLRDDDKKSILDAFKKLGMTCND